MNKIVVVHFQPPELYPPIQNLLAEFGKMDCEVLLITTQTSSTLSLFHSNTSTVKILRYGKSGLNLKSFRRYYSYLNFYVRCLVKMIFFKPHAILYYETLSSWPVYMYKRLVSSTCRIYIHYHEYTSTAEYESGMKLTRYFHHLEKKWLYKNAAWISHTNAFRLNKFKEDLHPLNLTHTYVLPNYPPQSWYTKPKAMLKLPLKIVYAGSLSLDTMYSREFADWVITQKGQVQWDIYAYNYDTAAKDYLTNLQSDFITLKEGVNYDALPYVLRNYDVGVILYKGHIANYVYNAPNKLFEYLTCGLTVVLPTVMDGSLPYVTHKTYPEVIATDFTALYSFFPMMLMNRSEYVFTEAHYTSADALQPLVKHILEH